jgi:dihydrofolate reductase
MTGSEYQPITVSRRVGAPASVIFPILADPGRHREFDGSGMLRGVVRGTKISAVGDEQPLRRPGEVSFGRDSGEVAQQPGVDIHAIRLWPQVLDGGPAAPTKLGCGNWIIGARVLGRNLQEGVLMRRVVLQMGVTLDGYVAGTGGEGDWGLPAEHPDVRAWKVASLRQVGTHIMGRVTYEQMAGHWPNATGDYADFMNDLPKVVFSKTLQSAGWAGARIARGDLAGEIAALKSEPGGEIMAHGGAAFVQALSRLSLIDEYRLVILPVALGNGLPLFKDLPKPLRVDLTEAKTFTDGTVIHVYQPVRTTQ